MPVPPVVQATGGQPAAEPERPSEPDAPSRQEGGDAESTRALAGAILAGVAGPPVTGPGVVVVVGASAGRRFPLAGAQVVGRGQGADIRLDDPLASRRHLRLEVREAVATLGDLRSKNGVSVNGRRLRKRSVPLRNGDVIGVGATLLRYEDGAAAPSRKVPVRAQPVSPGPAPPDGGGAARWPAPATAWLALASLALLAIAALLAGAAG